MTYSVKEMFYTLQGEGANAGRAAIFCRFAGCNLWSGRESDRATAVCKFCDTDFVGTDGQGGGRFESADALVQKINELWPANDQRRKFVVLTGGEPLLQVDQPLLQAFHRVQFQVAVESNGTIPAPEGIDWLCISPKWGSELVQQSGNELKLVFPQGQMNPAIFETLAFERFYLQPMDGPNLQQNTALAVAFCLANPRWRLSLQTHKILGIQ
jgi:7-carboxy-7-deazaguanine synthase